VAVLADTHGNAVALEAVLRDVDRLGIHNLVVAGDIVNLGPDNDRVVDLLADRNAQMIRGNQEQELVATWGTTSAPLASTSHRRGS
jgi:predicted phosphodiesterase